MRIAALSLLSLLGLGCTSLESGFQEALRRELPAAPAAPAQALSEADLALLPAPVQRYVRRTGAVGRPVPRSFRLEFKADMFQKPGGAAMPSTSVQYNVLQKPSRTFFMRSLMFGLPVQVLHAYAGEEAIMKVRVASLATVVDLAGDDLSRGETVTVLNDLCFYAPGALADPRLAWTAVDGRTVDVTFRNGRHTVRARLHFDEAGDLVDFSSDDRPALVDGKLLPYRWRTPVRGWREVGGVRVPTHGEAVYRYPEGDFTYGVFDVTGFELDPPAPW